MDETSSPSVWDQAGGFFGDLANAVIQVDQAKAAREIAKQNTSGGSTIAPNGALIKNSTQSATATAVSKPLIPTGVWIVGSIGLMLVFVAFMLHR